MNLMPRMTYRKGSIFVLIMILHIEGNLAICHVFVIFEWQNVCTLFVKALYLALSLAVGHH